MSSAENKKITPDFETLGATLKRGRELRAISLEEVAEATCVRLNYLNAIEQNQLDRLPGLVFLKGYVRAYANYVGLNLEETMVLLEDFTAPRVARASSFQKKEVVYTTLLFCLFLLSFFCFWFFKRL